MLIALWLCLQNPTPAAQEVELQARKLLEEAVAVLQAAATLRLEAELVIKPAATMPEQKKKVTLVARDRTHMKLTIASDFFDEKEIQTIVMTPGKHLIYAAYLNEYESAEIKATPKNKSYPEPATEFYMHLTVAKLIPPPEEQAEVRWAFERLPGGRARVTLTVTRFEPTGNVVKTNVFDIDEATKRLHRYDVTLKRGPDLEMRLAADYSRLDTGSAVELSEFDFPLPKDAKLVKALGDPREHKLQSYVGKTLPDLALESLDGKASSLKRDVGGKVALVAFWSCNLNHHDQAKQWAEVRKNVDAADFEVVAISWDKPELLASFETTSQSHFLYRRTDKALIDQPLPFGAAPTMPIVFVVDRKGVIRSIYTTRPKTAGVFEQEVLKLLEEK